MMTYHSDYDEYGFRKSDILPILAKHGIVLDLDGGEPEASSGRAVRWPGWKRLLALRSRLSLYEVVCAFVDVSPDTEEGEDASRYRSDYAAYEKLVREALHDGYIGYAPDTANDRIMACDLASWCDRSNIPRPLPWNFDRPPATDAELQQALQENRQQLAEATEQITRLQAEVSRLQSELAQAKDSQPIQQQTQDGDLKFRHETRLLHLVAAAQERYAGENLDISDRDTWPKKADVIEWLREQEPGLSGKVAEVIDTIAMPFNRGK